MAEIDRIFEELAYISSRLAEGPPTAERLRLRERRKELHLAAERLATPGPEALRAELEELERQWERLRKTRIDVVEQAGDLSAGGNFGFTADAMRINRAIDESGGRAAIEERIRQIKTLLAEEEQ